MMNGPVAFADYVWIKTGFMELAIYVGSKDECVQAKLMNPLKQQGEPA